MIYGGKAGFFTTRLQKIKKRHCLCKCLPPSVWPNFLVRRDLIQHNFFYINLIETYELFHKNVSKSSIILIYC